MQGERPTVDIDKRFCICFLAQFLELEDHKKRSKCLFKQLLSKICISTQATHDHGWKTVTSKLSAK